MTGHFVRGIAWFFTLLASLAAPAAALDLTLTTANDFFSGTRQEDDLYTADLSLELWVKGRRIAFGERLFTDRERGIRFDETYARVGFRMPELGGWHGQLELGILHVGRGLAGERAQNAVHRLIGSDRVDLDYAVGQRWYPTAELTLGRRLYRDHRRTLDAHLELATAPGFRSWARFGLGAEWTPWRDLQIRAGLGAMVNQVQLDALDARVDDWGPSWSLGVGYRRFAVVWSLNRYGTGSRHVSLAYRLRLGSGRDAPIER